MFVTQSAQFIAGCVSASVFLFFGCPASIDSATTATGGKSGTGGDRGSGGSTSQATGGSSTGGSITGGGGTGGTSTATGGATAGGTGGATAGGTGGTSMGTGTGGATAGGTGGTSMGTGGFTSGGTGGSSTGTGGATAGGTGGTSTGAGGAGSIANCPADAVFCDDFESYTLMSPPSGKWKTWTVGAGTLVVDSMQHSSGTKAAHIHGKVSQSGAGKEQAFMLAQQAPSFPVTGTTLYLRFMMYGTRFPFTGVTTANHVAIAWIGSAKGLNAPDQGETNKGYLFADYNGISIEPMWNGYFRDTSKHFKDANQANAWHCWEILIDNAGGPPPGATGAALPHIWEDGVALKLAAAGSADAQYAAIPFEAIMFSLWSPQADTSVADYWIDDVAVSKSRINCPAK